MLGAIFLNVDGGFRGRKCPFLLCFIAGRPMFLANYGVFRHPEISINFFDDINPTLTLLWFIFFGWKRENRFFCVLLLRIFFLFFFTSES